jgi:hypothetical protein
MKASRKQKQVLDLGVILAAASLAVSFLITACRKRSIRAAVGAILSAGCGVALTVARDGTGQYRKQPAEEKLFTDEECRAARAHVRCVLGGRHDEQAPPRVLREIPRDEEATEEDFL